jgi:hypothetical protein
MTAKKFFLSFVEEAVMNPNYEGYIGGRVEVFDEPSEDGYAIEEIRFFTNKQSEFYYFRERWDFETVGKKTLNAIRQAIKERFSYET